MFTIEIFEIILSIKNSKETIKKLFSISSFSCCTRDPNPFTLWFHHVSNSSWEPKTKITLARATFVLFAIMIIAFYIFRDAVSFTTNHRKGLARWKWIITVLFQSKKASWRIIRIKSYRNNSCSKKIEIPFLKIQKIQKTSVVIYGIS
jgi:hypothetical protein